MCPAQRHNTVRSVRLEPMALLSSVKRSTTEPPLQILSSLMVLKGQNKEYMGKMIIGPRRKKTCLCGL